MKRLTCLVLVLLLLSAAGHASSSDDVISRPDRIMLFLDIATIEDKREFKIVLLAGEPGYIMFGDLDGKPGGSLEVEASVTESDQILISFDMAQNPDDPEIESAAFKMIVNHSDPASFVLSDPKGFDIEVGVIAELVSSNVRTLEASLPGDSIPATTCRYQECGSAWAWCCNACCDQGCGWFGKCQFP